MDITYHFQILNLLNKNIIYERAGLLTSYHKIEVKLKNDTKYFWRVQANYTEKGENLSTGWNGWAGFIVHIMGVATGSEPYIFITPNR